MSEYIENVISHTSKLDWAFPFQRTGAFPLDRSTLFSSLEDAQLYASGGKDSRGLSGSAYIGQPISVYDKENGIVSLYIINSDKTLKEAGNAFLGDSSTIEIIDNKIQLKGFNSGYYAFIPAEINENGEVIKQATYQYTEGFKEGLEVRVISVPQSDGTEKYQIAWYEPNLDTIDGLSSQIENLTVEVLNKVDKDTVYTKQEIINLLSEIDHLKYKKVNSLDEIDLNDPEVNKYIYLILIDTTVEGVDKYDEYIVIDGVLERIGSWDAKLDDYALKTDLDTKVDKEDNKSLVSNTEIDKLLTVKANAEENLVKIVSDDFNIDEEGKLSFKEISISKVTNLENILNNKVNQSDFNVLNDSVNSNIENIVELTDNTNKLSNNVNLLTSTVGTFDIKINNLESALNDYSKYVVSKAEYEEDKKIIFESITWSNM